MSKPRSIEYGGSVGGTESQEQLRRSRQKLDVMALALRNMAQALDEQIALDPEGSGLLDRSGEMYVSMFLDHGRAWQNDNRTYGVFEAWVHFTAGPGAVASTRLDSTEKMEQVEAEGIGRD